MTIGRERIWPQKRAITRLTAVGVQLPTFPRAVKLPSALSLAAIDFKDAVMTQTAPIEKAGRKPRRMTEIDRQMAEARQTKTMKAVAQEFGVPVSQVQRAEWLAWRLKKSHEYLDKDPESLVGLEWAGEISSGLGDALTYGDPTARDRNGNRSGRRLNVSAM